MILQNRLFILFVIILFLIFNALLCQAHLIWLCNDIKLSLHEAIITTKYGSYGHYTGSCMRREAIDGVIVVCEEETFCGTGLEQSISSENDELFGRKIHFYSLFRKTV